jgi:hypothetical protein
VTDGFESQNYRLFQWLFNVSINKFVLISALKCHKCTHLPALSIFSNTGLSDNSLFGHAKKPHTMNFQSTKTMLANFAHHLLSMKKFLVSGLNRKTYHVGERGGCIDCWLTNFLLNWDQIDKTVYRQWKGWLPTYKMKITLF